MRSHYLLATRASPLAIAQAEEVQRLFLNLYPDLRLDLLPIKTTGDRILDRSFKEAGGKGLFVKELEEALITKKADFAVHSMKDVPVLLPDPLKMGVILKREEAADGIISKNNQPFLKLPLQAKIGTTSLRRKAQLLDLRPDLQVFDLRGNVGTRLQKLKEGEFDGIILAVAGLNRLGLREKLTERLPLVPAPGQGAIGLEYRRDDQTLETLLAPLGDFETECCVAIERKLLQKFGNSGCTLPLGIWAHRLGDTIELKIFVQDAENRPYKATHVQKLDQCDLLVDMAWDEMRKTQTL